MTITEFIVSFALVYLYCRLLLWVVMDDDDDQAKRERRRE